jgi:hypothetical protein
MVSLYQSAQHFGRSTTAWDEFRRRFEPSPRLLAAASNADSLANELQQMLREAAELEHALCVQYLYAAFTLRTGGEADVSASTAALTQSWRQQLTRVALQEMYHLMLVNNIAIAVGAKAHLWQPGFPQQAGKFGQITVPLSLTPFGEDTMKRFLCWERPINDGWWVDTCEHCGDEARSLALSAPMMDQKYDSIGALYASISQLLWQYEGPWRIEGQVTSALVPFAPLVVPIDTLEKADHYIGIIVTEGEGHPDNGDSLSHFAYFNQIYRQFQSARKGSQDAWPDDRFAWPTVPNPTYDQASSVGTKITDPDIVAVGELFTCLYRLLLYGLAVLFSAPDSVDPAKLADAVLAIMPLAVDPLAVILTRLEFKDHPGTYAGPSFELPPLAEFDKVVDLYRQRPGALYDEAGEVTRRCRLLSVGGPFAQLEPVAARLETLLPLFAEAVTR